MHYLRLSACPSSAKLLKRDPRMVERKKTGRAKARKAVCLSLILNSSCAHYVVSLVHLGQAVKQYFRDTLEASCYYSRIMLPYVVVMHTSCSRMTSEVDQHKVSSRVKERMGVTARPRFD